MTTRLRLSSIFIIAILPAIIFFPYALYVTGLYLSNIDRIQQYPKSITYGLTAPKGLVEMTLSFLKPDLERPDYALSLHITFYTNQTPNPWFAICGATCPMAGGLSVNFSPNETRVEQTRDYSVHYSSWFSNTTISGSLPQFSPYSFPIDYYSTHRIYISLDSGFRIDSVKLESEIPPQFMAFFEDIGRVKFSDLPSDIQIKGFDTGLVLGFSVGMARSPANLLILFFYTVCPILSLYEVGGLSFLSVSYRKDRLAIYVGALFTVFAYFLTLRQFLPPCLTILEAILAIGMVLWIFIEGFLFLDGRL
jgi:hypothetical protein